MALDTTPYYVPPPRWTIYFDADGEMLDISAVRDGLHPDAIAVEVRPASPGTLKVCAGDCQKPIPRTGPALCDACDWARRRRAHVKACE